MFNDNAKTEKSSSDTIPIDRNKIIATDKKITVLIVEDNKVNMLLLKTILKNLFVKTIIHEVVNGKEAVENFELIQEKYSVGNENIISLLDAQNTYIISKLNENISITDYLIDLSSIYYFSGNIDILVESNKKESLEKKILEIMKENR